MARRVPAGIFCTRPRRGLTLLVQFATSWQRWRYNLRPMPPCGAADRTATQVTALDIYPAGQRRIERRGAGTGRVRSAGVATVTLGVALTRPPATESRRGGATNVDPRGHRCAGATGATSARPRRLGRSRLLVGAGRGSPSTADQHGELTVPTLRLPARSAAGWRPRVEPQGGGEFRSERPSPAERRTYGLRSRREAPRDGRWRPRRRQTIGPVVGIV